VSKHIFAIWLLCWSIPASALSFISLDCTQYGKPGAPVLIMLDGDTGTAMIGPAERLPETPEAIEFFTNIRNKEHEDWVDPACAI